MEPYDQTAILFFSRTPRQEALHKQLAGPHSYRVSRILLQHSFRELRRSNLPLCVSLGHQQSGNTFGERLANATEAAFAQGYRKLIIVGSDSPGLDASLLRKAHSQLQEKDIVLGPSTDGGLYLIGISQDKYNRQQFIDLSWETSRLQQSIKQYLSEQQASVNYLEVLGDLDSAQNFTDWLPSLLQGRLFAELHATLHQAAITHNFSFLEIFQDRLESIGILQRRGPPIATYLRA